MQRIQRSGSGGSVMAAAAAAAAMVMVMVNVVVAIPRCSSMRMEAQYRLGRQKGYEVLEVLEA